MSQYSVIVVSVWRLFGVWKPPANHLRISTPELLFVYRGITNSKNLISEKWSDVPDSEFMYVLIEKAEDLALLIQHKCSLTSDTDLLESW